ncbi:MAG: alpha/beta hydrolase [Candidatus Pacebacteria bacterium]|nr:alpha/beta hydrolase [Candidatus Paceibacterota bacterium]MBP9772331.1 alpha/beta hydrolase [Candidatus Paceibacterota bacterium]
MIKVFIVHGFMASAESNWNLLLRDKLSSLGCEVHLLAMPQPNFPRQKKWLEKLRESIDTSDGNTVLIGHSLGGVVTLRYLESLVDTQKIEHAIIVSGAHKKVFDYSMGTIMDFLVTANFFTKKTDFEEIKKHANKFTVIYGSDDPVVPPVQGAEIAEGLGVIPHIIEDGGHLCEDSGKAKYTELIKIIVDSIQKYE